MSFNGNIFLLYKKGGGLLVEIQHHKTQIWSRSIDHAIGHIAVQKNNKL
jgi:hypothetical protein